MYAAVNVKINRQSVLKDVCCALRSVMTSTWGLEVYTSSGNMLYIMSGMVVIARAWVLLGSYNLRVVRLYGNCVDGLRDLLMWRASHFVAQGWPSYNAF